MRKKRSVMRGRLPGIFTRADIGFLESIFIISLKHGIDPDKFFEKIVIAWKHKESTCNGLKIQCRTRAMNDSHVFLFTNEDKVIAQFPIPERILSVTKPLKDLIDTESLRKRSVKEDVKSHDLRIGDLKFGMKRVNLRARIIEVPESRQIFTRFGTNAMVSNILIGDKTGTIRLPLWNRQIDTVSKDDVVRIENAYVAAFRGEPQLRIRKKGKLEIIEEEGSLDKKEL